MSRAIGIDLGTTFCAVAVLDGRGQPELVPNLEGERLTPAVWYVHGGQVLVGSFAREAGALHPSRTIAHVKRHMGDAAWRASPEDSPALGAVDLSAYLLEKLRNDAAAQLGEDVRDAVITVPAWFGDRERRATAEAAQRAGLQVLALLNEPTSAAFAYGLAHRGEDRRVLVLDLGGGTCDASVVAIQGRDIGVVATMGDARLGGADWDEALVQHAAAAFLERHGVDLCADPVAAHDLRRRCVALKLALSRRDRATLVLDGEGRVLRMDVERATFEALTAPLVGRCEAVVRKVLAEARLTAAELSQVVLAGGSTRMPMIREMVRRLTGIEPDTSVHPDECVAMGAALVAGMFQAARSGDQAPVDLRTQDITGHTVSVLVREGQTLRALPVLPRGEPLPASATLRGLRTRRDGQRTLDLWLLQGEGTDPEAATPLGCMSFHGLSPEPAGANVELEVRHGVDGLVVVEARGSDGRPLPHQVGPPEVPLRDLVAGKLPMDVVIVLDSSGSMYGPPFAEGCALAQQLVESVRGPNRRVGLISTSSEAVEDLRADVGPLLRTLRAIVPVGAGSLAGALERAGTWLDQGVCRHRVAVLITDALLEDAEGCAEAASRLGARGVDVHVVHVGDRGDASLLAMFAQGRGAITRAAPSLAPQESIPELHRA